jgi:hypothetical protein
MRELSTPLTKPPSFLSTVSMVVDDESSIVKDLVKAERKSPPVYDPAKEMFCKVLQGKLRFAQALTQARALVDPERRCAVEVLEASEEFLRGERVARIGPFPDMNHSLPNGLDLLVSQVHLRHLEPAQLMILHFWRQELSRRQLSAAAAILKSCLEMMKSDFQSSEIDFISVTFPDNATSRSFRVYHWADLAPLQPEALQKFWEPFCRAWRVYQAQGPRPIKSRRGPDLFGLR